MHEELSHHKAAILVPRICECRTYEQIVVDSLVLPEGLVLTEEQKAELKKRLISQTTTMEETLSAFLEPLMLPYLGKMEVA